jgi:hypothetical protein
MRATFASGSGDSAVRTTGTSCAHAGRSSPAALPGYDIEFGVRWKPESAAEVKETKADDVVKLSKPANADKILQHGSFIAPSKGTLTLTWYSAAFLIDGPLPNDAFGCGMSAHRNNSFSMMRSKALEYKCGVHDATRQRENIPLGSTIMTAYGLGVIEGRRCALLLAFPDLTLLAPAARTLLDRAGIPTTFTL